MQDRVYNFFGGIVILSGLYFSLPYLIYILIAVFIFEGTTGFYFIPKKLPLNLPEMSDFQINKSNRFSIPSNRIWRFLIASILVLTFVFFYNTLWLIPWFLGFALLGAGVSGVCPIDLGLKYIGFR